MKRTEQEQAILDNWPVVTADEIETMNDEFPHYIFFRRGKDGGMEYHTSCCGRTEVIEPVRRTELPWENALLDASYHNQKHTCPWCSRGVTMKDLGKAGKRKSLDEYRLVVLLHGDDHALYADALSLHKEYGAMDDLTARPTYWLCSGYRFARGEVMQIDYQVWDKGAITWELGQLGRKKLVQEPFKKGGLSFYTHDSYAVIGRDVLKNHPFFRYCQYFHGWQYRPGGGRGYAHRFYDLISYLTAYSIYPRQIEMLVNLKKVADPLLGYAETALHNAQKALDEAEPADEEYTDLRDALQKAQDAYDNISGQLNGYQAQLDEGKRQMYAQGLISSPSLSNEQLVTEAKAALRQMKVKLLQGQLQLTTGTATAYTQFDAARTRLDEGWQQYNDGVQQLADSRAEYESRKADAEQQLADGLAQLNDAEEQVSQIKSGEWYVLDRSSTVSFVTFEQYADRMDAIARVFPVFFFLVAALVATTTMTRMVDENRLQLGTLKALGYSNAKIAGKYLFYALSASVLGSIVGMVIGFVVFPLIIWYAYQMIFSMSTFTLHFYPGMAAASVAISAAVIGFATWNACRASLKEKTAALLLPRAPVAGKRIFLEYITPLWQHMSFSQKTTARNLFRYKKRFFMTVLGVAGCTALLLIGFGIQDSILPIVDKQSGQLTHNDLTISLSDEKALTMEQGLADTLDSSSAVHSWGAFYTKSTTLYNEEGGSADVSIVGAEDDARMTEYFTFRTRVGHDPIPFEEDSVILTEKTALNLELSVGDTFYVEAADGSRVPLVLTGITENYMFTRLYLSNAQLQALLGNTPEWNTVYGLTGCTTEAEYNALRTKLLDCNYVSSVSFTEDTTSMFGSLIGSLNYVVVLIIVCAAALAAVVLYNLISVNLAERKKELATIKVLGFYDKEVYRYIFREIELLSLIGSGVGLLLGVPLHRFIVLTVEMDQLMFIRTIAPRSYLLAVALTMLFTFVVCFAMRRHVRHISMVESMKAPE